MKGVKKPLKFFAIVYYNIFMRSNRFFVKDLHVTKDNEIILNDLDLIHQWTKVLRLKPDVHYLLELIDGSGIIYVVDILSMNSKQILCKLIKTYKSSRELKQKIIFALPIIKAESFSWMLRKLTELGVQEFYPVIFERSQKDNILAIQKNYPRLQKIIIEAVEQCEGAVLPQLHEAQDLQSFITATENYKNKFFAFEKLADNHQASQLEKFVEEEIILLIGPEGGISEAEAKLLNSKSFQALSLGSRLLKAETAAIVLTTKFL